MVTIVNIYLALCMCKCVYVCVCMVCYGLCQYVHVHLPMHIHMEATEFLLRVLYFFHCLPYSFWDSPFCLDGLVKNSVSSSHHLSVMVLQSHAVMPGW